MTVCLDLETKRVLWYNDYQSKSEALSRLNENIIWIDGTIPETEEKEGYYSVYYVNEDMQSIRVEYEPIPESGLTQLDRIEEQINKNQDDLRQEGANMMMEELIKRGVVK